MWGLGQSGLEEKISQLERRNRDLEQRLRELESPNRRDACTREVLERLSLIHFSIDLHDRLRDWNAISQRQMGWQKGDVVGKSIYEFLVADVSKSEVIPRSSLCTSS